jgi:anti-sigma factor (TIGR02949 family)
MPCDDLIRTQLLLDGELEGEDAQAAQTHLQSCAECSELAADMQGIRDAIRNHATRHQAPELVRARVRRQIREHGTPPRAFWTGAVSGAGLTALAASLAALFLFLPRSGETVAGGIADSHVEALMHGPLIQVASSDHHTVKPWFAGRIDLSPPVQDFRGEGFALAGGRLDRAGDAPAAVVVYRHGKHVIDLYVWHGRRAAESATRHGYHVISWQSGDLDFSAVSDTDPRELAAFVRLVKAERE